MMKTQLPRFLAMLTPLFSQALPAAIAAEAGAPRPAIQADGESQQAPHRQGNVYAPEVRRSREGYRMWFGGQGLDGHDRIHLAVSTDGIHWKQQGVVLQDPTANHLNDPSVVEADGTLFMFYTRAAAGVTDEIAVATSRDGIRWETKGTALAAGAPGSWDALAVGQPSVLFSKGLFRMWYDGRKDLPLGAPDATAPKSAESHRYVGYATSTDGIHWQRHGDQPIYGHDAGGIHVVAIGDHLALLSESHEGTEAAISRDGLEWRSLGLLVKKADLPAERHGHVTPFLLPDADLAGAVLYYGAASRVSWDGNSICLQRLSAEQWTRLKTPGDWPER